jgi:eukaryotic translation initiation factor 2C
LTEPCLDSSQDPGHRAQPDLRIKRIENKTYTDTQRPTARAKSPPGARLPQRPGFGTQGREVVLWANYFEVVSHGDLVLYRYAIEILPDQAGKVPAGKRARRVVELLIEEYLAPQSRDIATDFKSTLISRIKLDLDEEFYNIRYRGEGEDGPSPHARTYRIRLSGTGTLTVSDLLNYLTSTQVGALMRSKEEIIQALNIVIGHHPKAALHIASIGANKHFDKATATDTSTEKMSLGAGLQAIRGFFVSARAATARILINVQVEHGAFYQQGPLDRVMVAYLGENGPNMIKLGNFLKNSLSTLHILSRRTELVTRF